MEKTTIAVIGLGGVGGYFGFKLAQTYAISPDVDISFVARGETYRIVAEKGLTLHSPEASHPICHPKRVVTEVEQLGPVDVYLLCVKEYDLEKVCASLKGVITEKTTLLPLMNGADIYQRIRKVISKGIVLPACVYVASHIKQKGEVEHKGKPGKIFMGQDPRFPDFVPEKLCHLMQEAGINLEYTPDAFPAIWAKYLFIASFGLVSACHNKSIGEIIEAPALKAEAKAIMGEIVAIAEQEGITFGADAVEKTFERARTFPPHTPTSLQLDIHSHKGVNELDLFAGTILRLGKAHQIPVPATEAIYHRILESLEALK